LSHVEAVRALDIEPGAAAMPEVLATRRPEK
jgi:hypothetical protein